MRLLKAANLPRIFLEFSTNVPRGMRLLKALVAANAALRARNEQLLAAAGEPQRVEAEGERLYVEKPTLRGEANLPSTKLPRTFHQPSTRLPPAFHQPSTNLPETSRTFR